MKGVVAPTIEIHAPLLASAGKRVGSSMRVLKIALDGNTSQSASCGLDAFDGVGVDGAEGVEGEEGLEGVDGVDGVETLEPIGAAVLPPPPPPPHATSTEAVASIVADASARDVRRGYFFDKRGLMYTKGLAF
jgi:hypothetical protein